MGMKITKISSAEYVQKTVINADGASPASHIGEGLTAYYTAEGNPPGTWLGKGITGIGKEAGQIVTSADAVNVWQEFRNPSTGEHMGKPPRKTKAKDNQLAESSKQENPDTAGFDLTFTVPKDVSIIWALGDTTLQKEIAAAHQAAIQQVFDYLETEVAQTRAGHAGVVTLGVKGLIAGSWNHWDSREGDPHLHTHVLISNRVQREIDGKWVTLDSRAFFKNTVQVSELHQNLLMDELTRRLGISWSERENQTSRAVVPEIEQMPKAVRQLFSTRDHQIKKLETEYTNKFKAKYEREPNYKEQAEIHSRAWQATRKAKPKEITSLANKCEQWREQAEAGLDINSLISSCINNEEEPELDGEVAHSVTEAISHLTLLNLKDHTHQTERSEESNDIQKITQLAQTIEETITTSRSTWSVANIRAEVERMTRMVRAASPEIRIKTNALITEAVLAKCIELTPQRYTVDLEDERLTHRARSIFDDSHRTLYTTRSALDREQKLIEAMTTKGILETPEENEIKEILNQINANQELNKGFKLAADQEKAVEGILQDSTRLSVLIGPAGTGKTSTMHALAQAWKTIHHEGKVIGLTTSAQAAKVLGQDLEEPTNTIAKWLYESTIGKTQRDNEASEIENSLTEHESGAKPLPQQKIEALRRRLSKLIAQNEQWKISSNQLVIVDEASMASTMHLAELVHQVEEAGAKILLVGDHRQIDAVEAGGALELLSTQTGAHQLSSVWRFKEEWEKEISLKLRHVKNDTEANEILATYEQHGRLKNGDDEQMLEQAFTNAYRAVTEGKQALIIASTNEIVNELNQRFTQELRASGKVNTAKTVPIKDGNNAALGDIILTRTNNRLLKDNQGQFITNGSLLEVIEIHPDGAVTAIRKDTQATLTLPAKYVAENVELGYATTAHRSQGMTVDESHLVITSDNPIPAELLYVGMTRGKNSNYAYVSDGNEETEFEPLGSQVAIQETPTWQDRLKSMMLTSAAELSAIHTMKNQHEEMHSLNKLVSEYEYLTTLENHEPLISELCNTHELNELQVRESLILPSLLAAYRTARAVNPEKANTTLNARIIGVGNIEVDQNLKILTARLRAQTKNVEHPNLLPGGIPKIGKNQDENIADLANQIEAKISYRIQEVLEKSVNEEWVLKCPAPLRKDVAIYRDLYKVRTASILGAMPPKRDSNQVAHWKKLEVKLATHGVTDKQAVTGIKSGTENMPMHIENKLRGPKL